MAWSYTAKCWSYSPTLDSQNERKEDAAGVSFLVVSQHRLSKQKAFLVWRVTEMALTVSERLRVQSIASALQAGIGCLESTRKRKKPVKTTIAVARFPHPETRFGRKLPSVLCVYSAALLLLFRYLYFSHIFPEYIWLELYPIMKSHNWIYTTPIPQEHPSESLRYLFVLTCNRKSCFRQF